MPRSLAQRTAAKFSVKLDNFAVQYFPMINTAFDDNSFSERQVHWWHKVLLKRREMVSDEAHAGGPWRTTTDENVTRVRDLLNSDRHLSVRLVAQI